MKEAEDYEKSYNKDGRDKVYYNNYHNEKYVENSDYDSDYSSGYPDKLKKISKGKVYYKDN